MTERLVIRDTGPADSAAIEQLYPQAFPDEDLLPIVRELLRQGPNVLSLAAVADGGLAGHVVFTICGIAGATCKAALLGPLAVAPTRQRHGVGGALVQAGVERLKVSGVSRVCVLGDPAYYRHYGFAPDNELSPPYALPEEWREAWQSLKLDGGGQSIRGQLVLPEPWRRKALWLP